MTGRPSADVTEDVDFLTLRGVSWPEICTRLDMSPGAIAQALYRRGRPDLAKTYSTEASRARRAPTDPDDERHGKLATYSRLKCRCDACTGAHRAVQNARRRTTP